MTSRRLAPTILVPGAAGAAAIGAMRWLRRSGFEGRIVATDGEPLSAGFAFSDANYVVDDITDPACYDRALEVIAREKIEVILPTSPIYCAVCSGKKEDLAALGAVLPCSDNEVVQVCQDKCLFQTAVAAKFPVPELIPLDDDGPRQYPCFVKPRWGSGSRGAGRCCDYHDWLSHRKFSTPLIAQEVLEGTEYSVDVLSDLDSEAKLAVVRERVRISEGVSTTVRVIRNEEIQSLCTRMAQHLHLKGISCMQLKRDRSGQLRFLEVNAHFGGTSIATMLAGVDLVRLLLLVAFRETIPIPIAREITVVRHFDEVVLE